MKLTRIILAITTAFLGLVHLGFTPVFYPGWRIDSLWFAGTGLTLVILAFTNALLLGRQERWTKICGAVANFAALTLMTMIAVTLREGHAWFACALVLGLFVTGILDSGSCSCGKCCCESDRKE